MMYNYESMRFWFKAFQILQLLFVFKYIFIFLFHFIKIHLTTIEKFGVMKIV